MRIEWLLLLAGLVGSGLRSKEGYGSWPQCYERND